MTPREPLWRRYLRFFGPDPRADADDEIRFHLERLEEDFRTRGLDAEAARRAARARFGDPGAVRRALDAAGRRRLRRARWAEWLEALGQDARTALRRLRRQPGFTLAAVGVLALGIGATTAMFSAVDAALLRPLPFPGAARLVVLRHVTIPYRAEDFRPAGGGATSAPVRTVEIGDVAALPGVFSHVAVYATGGLNLSGPDQPRRVRVGVVSADFFNTLGIFPARGRAWSPADGDPGAPAVAVLSDHLWRGQYGAGDVVGRNVRLNGRRYVIVGIMPPGFSFPGDCDLWIPLSIPITSATFEPFRGYLPSQILARIATGESRESAAARLLALWNQRAAALTPHQHNPYLDDMFDEVHRLGPFTPLQRILTGDRRPALLILLGATGLLLLIACVNVTNLLLGHAAARRREIAVRAVLGATRLRVVRQMLTESVILAGSGALVGLALAPLLLHLVRTLMPAALLAVAPPHVDLRVLAFATALALCTGVGFGTWPALGAARTDVGGTIKTGGEWGTTAHGARRLRHALVAIELGVALTLLVGANLMVRSLQRVLGTAPGFDPARVGTLELSFAESAHATDRRRLVQGVLRRLAADPGIERAGAVNDLPLAGGGIALTVEPAERPVPPGEQRPYARYLFASSGYFATFGIPLVAGRLFTTADESAARKSIVVNQTMAHRLWPGENPLGRGVMGPETYTVIGVVGDVRDYSLEQPVPLQMYLPLTATPPTTLTLVARGTLPPGVLLDRLRRAVRAVDPAQAVYNVRMMDAVLGQSVATRRSTTILIVGFGWLALLLAALGVYAVAQHGMTQRWRELGIRAALGASGGDLVRLVTREMATVAAVGLAAGLTGAWALSRFLASQLYGVGARDTLSLAVAAGTLVGAAALATLIPARRVMALHPMDVMRAE